MAIELINRFLVGPRVVLVVLIGVAANNVGVVLECPLVHDSGTVSHLGELGGVVRVASNNGETVKASTLAESGLTFGIIDDPGSLGVL